MSFAVDWDAKYDEVCQRDRFCSRLKSNDGTWLKPKSEIIALLKDKEVQKEIKEAAQKYGVDPTAVAGAIVAENSLNVGVKDSVQTWLASKMGITSIAGKNFSFGLGQIQLPAAMEAEAHIAKLEGRKPRTTDEIRNEIADPMGSIRIAASIIRKVQDDYKAQGFDISKDPGVLTTLYNLGKSESKAKEAKEAGRLPQVNYFGLFVNKYTTEIRSSAQLDKTTPIVSKSSTPTRTQPVSLANSSTLPKINTADTTIKKIPLVQTDIVTKPVSLLSSPYLCDTTEYGQNIERETKSTSYGAPIAVLEKNESYSEISRTLDCKSNAWTLVKSKNDKIGWVENEKLDKVHAKSVARPEDCSNSKSDITCRQNIEKATEKYQVPQSPTLVSSDKLVYLKPISATEEAEKITFKHEDFQCGNNIQRNSNVRVAVQPTPKPKTEQINTFKDMKNIAESNLNFIDNELQRMSKETNIPIDNLSEPENPYYLVADQLNRMKSDSKNCLRSLLSEYANCHYTDRLSKELQDKIKLTKYKPEPDLGEPSKLYREISDSYYPQGSYNVKYISAYAPMSEELESVTPEQIKESISYCKSRMDDVFEKYTVKATENNLPAIWYNVDSRSLFQATSKATNEQIQKHKSEFLTFAKFCQARANLVDENPNKNGIDCSQAPKYIQNNYQLFTKEAMAKIYKDNPTTLFDEINNQSWSMVPQETINEIMGIPSNQVQAQVSPTTQPYCPNKTADYIENLLNENPCIKRVYVPTRYLSNKLNSLSPKVIYRKFEDDDKYAIETGGDLCK